jgi:hypothetical protein
MSLRRSISKSFIGIHPESRTGQEVPRGVTGPLRPVKKQVNKERGSEMPGVQSEPKKKQIGPTQLEF